MECEDGCFVRASAVVVTVSEQVVKEEQQVRRRLRGKQPDPARVAGGELGDGAVDEAVIPGRVAKIAEMIVGVAKSPISRAPNAGVGWLTPLSREDEGYENLKEWEEELVNWHGHLKRVWYEEKELLGGEAMESWQLEWVKNIAKDVNLLEEMLKEFEGEERRQLKAVQKLEEEFLQTKTIPLEVVKEELELWKEAMAEEYASLTVETQAIKPLSSAEAEELVKWKGGVHPQGWVGEEEGSSSGVREPADCKGNQGGGVCGGRG